MDTLSIVSQQSARSREGARSGASQGNPSLTSQTTLEDTWKPEGSLPSYSQVENTRKPQGSLPYYSQEENSMKPQGSLPSYSQVENNRKLQGRLGGRILGIFYTN